MTEKVAMNAEDTETTWNYCRYHFGEMIEVYTTDKIMMRRYETFAQRYPEHCKLVKEDRYSMTFRIDAVCMGFKPRAPRKGPVLTEAQKQTNRERLEKIRTKKSEAG